MGLFGKIIRRVSNPFIKGTRQVGNFFRKNYGNVDSFARKATDFVDKNVLQNAEKVMNTVEKIPIVGDYVSKYTKPIEAGIDQLRSTVKGVGQIQRSIEQGVKGGVRNAIKNPKKAIGEGMNLALMTPEERKAKIMAELKNMAGKGFSKLNEDQKQLRSNIADIRGLYRPRRLR